MQGDLISRSALIEELNSIYLDNPYDDKEDILEKAIGIVDHMETAYSVEDVVERLEARHKFYENRFAEMSGTDRDVEDWGSIKSYKDAIAIVRNGGKE